MRTHSRAIVIVLGSAEQTLGQASVLNITVISVAHNASRLEYWQIAAPPINARGAVNF